MTSDTMFYKHWLKTKVILITAIVFVFFNCKSNTLKLDTEVSIGMVEEVLKTENEKVLEKATSFISQEPTPISQFASERSEGSVKIWTIFGITLGFWKHINGYQEANAFELSKKFTFSHVVKNIFKFLSSIPVLIIRAKRMHKLWPWSEFEPYLDTPISGLRKEFNIQVLS